VAWLAVLIGVGVLGWCAPADAYLDRWGFSPAPNRFLPLSALREFRADLSLVWPKEAEAEPGAPGPVAGLSNAQWVAADIIEKGKHGAPSILHLGFVLAGNVSLEARLDRISAWGDALEAAGAMRFVYAVLGIDDSNCINLLDPQADLVRRRITAALAAAFPGKPVGHVLDIAGWAEERWQHNCGPMAPDRFGFTGETIVFAYDYRTDGLATCAQAGREPSKDPRLNANLILRDLEAMLATLRRTETGARPVVLIAKGYHYGVCTVDPQRDFQIACFLSDLWSRLRRIDPGTSPFASVVAFLAFAWHDQCGAYVWTGFEHSKPLRAAARWIADHRGRVGPPANY